MADPTDTIAEEKVEEKVEETKVEEKVEPKKVEPQLSDEQKKAIDLYAALQDPKLGTTIVRQLAEQFGVLETKKEKEKAEESILDILKTGLGDEYGFLADKLAPAIEKALDVKVRGVESKIQDTERSLLEKEIDTVMNKIYTENKEAKGLENRVIELMDEILPSPRISTERYIRNLYSIASGEIADKTATTKAAEKITKNANDAASRLASSGADESRLSSGPSSPTLDEAIKMAMKQLKLE